MKLSVSNIAWSPEHKLEAYALLRDHGVSGLEFAPGLLFPDLDAPLEATTQECDRVLAELDEFGLRPSSMQSLLFGVPEAHLFGSSMAQETLQETMKGAIGLAARLNCRNLVFGSPQNRVIPDDMAATQAEAIWRDNFLRMGDTAAANGVVVALEPNPMQYGTNFMTSIADTLAVVRSVDHPAIRMNLDLGAAILTGEIKTFESWLSNALEISHHVHLSVPELAPLSTQAPIVQSMSEALEAAGWQNWISVEMRGGLDALSETLAACFGQE
ncbi:sugar phosphate isomerase/epimerase family protein [Ruegeria lacuscaerulensis]|uniref:sugar phosphate isomerase/epimerase family protein n=1 Tax=Ruegeria lacuscaerulensis TaxID=55218 RepID=UPI00147FBBE0|nr:sugar phosphate isomerase/epimerase family protein [Ruegeria lacuscaerulensis]